MTHIVKTSRPIWIRRLPVAVAIPAQRRGTAVAKISHDPIAVDDWTPTEGNYDLVALWLHGRKQHEAAPRGTGVEKIKYGYYHYDTWQPAKYRTCPIGAVYVALFGKRSIEIMPEYELMITRICQELPGCTRQELEGLGGGG